MTFFEKRTMFLYGAFGGILPTLANLAPMYITDWHSPLPTIGFFFGLAIFALIGGGVALTNSLPDFRQAIFAGLAAPAIITNLAAGASEANMRRKTTELFPHQVTVALGLVGSSLFMTPASAQTPLVLRGAAAAGASGAVAVFHPSVVGPGAPNTFGVKVTAQVSKDGKVTEVPMGEITNLQSDSAFLLPPGTNAIIVDGKTFPVENPVTEVAIDVKTRASKTKDFFWALGAPRDFKIQDVRVSKSKG